MKYMILMNSTAKEWAAMDTWPPEAVGAMVQCMVELNEDLKRRGEFVLAEGLTPPSQAKLVRVLWGEIFDVAVDVRPGSPTFGRWVGATLSGENFLQMYVPVGFAHGFCVTSEIADVVYKCSDLYDPSCERGLAWNDPTGRPKAQRSFEYSTVMSNSRPMAPTDSAAVRTAATSRSRS